MSGLVIALVLVLLVLLAIALLSGVRIVQEYERGIIFRLGRVLSHPKGPGLFFILPFGIDRMVKVNLQTVAMNVPPQDVITRDNVTVRVDAVIYFQVVDPLRAVVRIQNYLFGTSQVAQTTLRAILGRVDLDDLLSERERINEDLARVIDELTEPWGVKVTLVEVKDVEVPDTMQRAMARQAEAERDRRARIISAEGEFQASEKLSEAAEVMMRNPSALQLRFLQTVGEVAAERNSTLVMPVPIELLEFFRGAAELAGRVGDGAAGTGGGLLPTAGRRPGTTGTPPSRPVPPSTRPAPPAGTTTSRLPAQRPGATPPASTIPPASATPPAQPTPPPGTPPPRPRPGDGGDVGSTTEQL